MGGEIGGIITRVWWWKELVVEKNVDGAELTVVNAFTTTPSHVIKGEFVVL